MDNPNYKERVCMHFSGIARYCVILTCKLKYGHNFWTACPILKIFFGYVIRERFVIYYRKHHFNTIDIKGDIAFENIDYIISRKLVVRF